MRHADMHPMRLLIISAMALAAAYCHATSVGNLVLCDFESEKDLGRVEYYDSMHSHMRLTSLHTTHGRSAASLDIPVWQKDALQWPGFWLSPACGMPTDWTSYDQVSLDVYNDSPYPATVWFRVRDNQSRELTKPIPLAPNRFTTMTLDFRSAPSDLDFSKIREVTAYMMMPARGTTLVFDNLRLESRIPIQLQECRRTLSRIRGELADYPDVQKPYRDVLSRLSIVQTRAERASSVKAIATLRVEADKLSEGVNHRLLRLLSEARLKTDFARMHGRYPFVCGFATSMERVFPMDIPFGRLKTDGLTIELAGNESESAQLVLLASEADLKGVTVKAGALKCEGVTGPSGPVPSIQVAPVGFMKTVKPAYEVSCVGWHPEPILSFLKTFDVPKGRAQPVWVRVTAKPGTPPGTYSASLTVRMQDSKPLVLPVRVHVWGFDLPRETHLRTAMAFDEGFLDSVYKGDSKRLRDRYYDFLLENRLNPDNIYRTDPPRMEDLLRWDRKGMNAFSLLCVNLPEGLKPGEGFPEDEKKSIFAKLDSVVPQLKANGLYRKAYLYGFDEIRPESHRAMQEIFGAIKARYPDLPLITTAMDNSYGVSSDVGIVDCWCPLSCYYDPGLADEARQRGKQVWWYICMIPTSPFANWFIEYDTIDARMLMGVQNVKYRPDGFLYYALNRWPLANRPITTGPYIDWNPASYENYNGDGCLIYPGSDGPLSSIRLECLRDGIEDYEYFHILGLEILRVRGLHNPAQTSLLKQAESAKEISSRLVESLFCFNKSPEALYNKRRQVARAIEKLKKIR